MSEPAAVPEVAARLEALLGRGKRIAMALPIVLIVGLTLLAIFSGHSQGVDVVKRYHAALVAGDQAAGLACVIDAERPTLAKAPRLPAVGLPRTDVPLTVVREQLGETEARIVLNADGRRLRLMLKREHGEWRICVERSAPVEWVALQMGVTFGGGITPPPGMKPAPPGPGRRP